MKLTKDFKEFLELLNKNDVHYLIVGAYAMSLHGYVRFTGDLDVWILPESQNAKKTLLALHEFGFSSLQINEADLIKKDSIIQLGYPPVRIDIITSVSGLDFETCWAEKLTEPIDGILVNSLSLKNLRKNKSASGRKKDLGDLDNLPEK